MNKVILEELKSSSKIELIVSNSGIETISSSVLAKDVLDSLLSFILVNNSLKVYDRSGLNLMSTLTMVNDIEMFFIGLVYELTRYGYKPTLENQQLTLKYQKFTDTIEAQSKDMKKVNFEYPLD